MSQQAPNNHNSFSILHFNDVYDIQPDNIQPKGGSAYFASLMDRYREPSTLTFFSGDAFSPSLLSAENKGENMIKPLNSMKIDLACLGNHDFDYPLPHVQHLKNSTNFPWLLSNVLDKKSGQRLEGTEEYKIIQKGGFKIGIFSLAQQEWMDTLIPDYKQILEYIPWEQFADYMIKQLKSEKCDLIIALTHMMRYNDVKLAKKFPQIDLILGGHDHLVVHQQVNNSIIIKSGTNFKHFSFIEVLPIEMKSKSEKREMKQYEKQFVLENSKIFTRVILVEVNHTLANIQPKPELHEYVENLYKGFKQRQEKIAAHFQEDIDLRFKSIRRKQNAYLQFLVSLYRHYTKSDCALMNSGNFRADTYIPAGPVTYGLLTNIIQDEIVVLKASGQKLLKGLENCVSMYPNLSGRYSTFSGIQFTWDCTKEPYERILVQSVKINGVKLAKEKIYRVTVHGFVSKGGDGFDAFKDCDIDHDHFHDNNLLLVHQLLTGSLKLLTGYEKKYPGRISWIVDDYGHKVLKLHVPNPKNVKMIGEQEKKPENKADQKQEEIKKADQTQTETVVSELTQTDATQTDQQQNAQTQTDL